MPKRSYDTDADMFPDSKLPPAKCQKTERSHEENQERAYIAASRRADRSLEARIQSAKMASDIHRKRTGRGLKVSQEIVLKEEMYEETEDDMPRSYECLGAHLQTGSPELTHRASAYVVTQTAMATLAKYNQVNKMFNEAFPRMSQNSLYMSPLLNNSPSPPSSYGSRNHSISTQAQLPNMDTSISGASPGHTPIASQPPTPELSPGTTSVDPMESTSTPCQVPHSGFSTLPLDPRLSQPSVSSFTSELPNEVKMMANIDMSDPMAMQFIGEGMLPIFPGLDGYDGESSSLRQFDPNVPDSCDHPHSPDAYCESFPSSLDPPMDYPKVPQSDSLSQVDTSTCGVVGQDNWESLINFDIDQ